MIWTQKTILAAQYAFSAHKEQTDKLGVPYIFHLMEVTEKAATEDETIVALLHDFLEDIYPEWDDEYAFQHLMPLFGDKSASALIVLKHKKGVPYLDYLKKIVKNPLALAVKKYDLASNSNLNRLALLPDSDRARLEKKYEEAVKFLKEEENKNA